MSEFKKYVFSFLILGTCIAVMSGLIMMREKPGTEAPTELIPTVVTVAAAPFDSHLDLEVSGLVVPYREVRVPAQVSGKVIEKTATCEAGNYVEEGTLLIQIDKRDYEIEIDRLNAELKQAQNAIDSLADEIAGAEKNLDLAKREQAIYQREYDRRSRIGSAISQSDLDVASRNLINAEKSVTTLANSLSQLDIRRSRLESGQDLAKSQLAKAQLNLDRTTIRAPFDGVIVSEEVEQGDYVQMGADLLILEDTSQSEVRCNLRRDQLQWILENSPASAAAGEDLTLAYRMPPTPVEIRGTVGKETVMWNGIFTRFDGIGVDETTKTVPCAIDVKNPFAKTATGQKPLVRGMYVTVRIVIDTAPLLEGGTRLVKFPAVAVHPGDYIWTVVDNKLQRRHVEVIDRIETETETTAPIDDSSSAPGPWVVVRVQDQSIQAGDKIVVTPLAQPTVGAQVIESDGQ